MAIPANTSARVTLVKAGLSERLADKGCSIGKIERAVDDALEELIARKSADERALQREKRGLIEAIRGRA